MTAVKPLSELTLAEYKQLKDSGKFHELYPDATGVYSIDCENADPAPDTVLYQSPPLCSTKPTNKYFREIKPYVKVDVYDVLTAWNVTNPAIAHAIKKLLVPGQRGAKDFETDIDEAIEALQRAKELKV